MPPQDTILVSSWGRAKAKAVPSRAEFCAEFSRGQEKTKAKLTSCSTQSATVAGPTAAAAVPMSNLTHFDSWKVRELKTNLDELEWQIPGAREQLIDRL